MYGEVLVDLDVTDLHFDIQACTVKLFRGVSHRMYLPSMLGVDRPLTLLGNKSLRMEDSENRMI